MAATDQTTKCPDEDFELMPIASLPRRGGSTIAVALKRFRSDGRFSIVLTTIGRTGRAMSMSIFPFECDAVADALAEASRRVRELVSPPLQPNDASDTRRP